MSADVPPPRGCATDICVFASFRFCRLERAATDRVWLPSLIQFSRNCRTMKSAALSRGFSCLVPGDLSRPLAYLANCACGTGGQLTSFEVATIDSVSVFFTSRAGGLVSPVRRIKMNQNESILGPLITALQANRPPINGPRIPFASRAVALRRSSGSQAQAAQMPAKSGRNWHHWRSEIPPGNAVCVGPSNRKVALPPPY